jgi:hypothetical protein
VILKTSNSKLKNDCVDGVRKRCKNPKIRLRYKSNVRKLYKKRHFTIQKHKKCHKNIAKSRFFTHAGLKEYLCILLTLRE